MGQSGLSRLHPRECPGAGVPVVSHAAECAARACHGVGRARTAGQGFLQAWLAATGSALPARLARVCCCAGGRAAVFAVPVDHGHRQLLWRWSAGSGVRRALVALAGLGFWGSCMCSGRPRFHSPTLGASPIRCTAPRRSSQSAPKSASTSATRSAARSIARAPQEDLPAWLRPGQEGPRRPGPSTATSNKGVQVGQGEGVQLGQSNVPRWDKIIGVQALQGDSANSASPAPSAPVTASSATGTAPSGIASSQGVGPNGQHVPCRSNSPQWRSDSPNGETIAPTGGAAAQVSKPGCACCRNDSASTAGRQRPQRQTPRPQAPFRNCRRSREPRQTQPGQASTGSEAVGAVAATAVPAVDNPVPAVAATAIPAVNDAVPAVAATAIPAVNDAVPAVAATAVPAVNNAIPAVAATAVPAVAATAVPAVNNAIPADATAVPAVDTAVPAPPPAFPRSTTPSQP